MFVFLVVFSCGLVLRSSCADVVEGEPEILNNGTSLDTQDGDIAHITCVVRGKPRPLVRWEKKGLVIKDKDEGMAILSTSNSSVEESHLFVAVTSGGRRGEYTCVVTNKKGVSKQSFLITEKSRKLSTLDIAAILISVGITLFFVIAIGFLLWRARKKVKGSEKRQRARTISQSSAQENNALVGDSTDSTADEETRNGIRKSSHCVTAV